MRNIKYIKVLKICFLILLFNPSNSFAEYKWKKVGQNRSGDVFYVDLLSIKRVGNNAYLFSLTDYIKPTEQGILSAKVYQEFSCKDYGFRYHKDFYYEKPMGNGEPSLTVNEVSKWRESPMGSVSEKIGKFVCNFK